MVGYSCGYVVGASATQFFMDVYDVTASPARVDAAGDTITRSLTTAGQDIYQEAGPFTLSAGQKTFQMYGFIPSGGPDVSLITGTPIAFTQSFSRHRMWVREV